MRKTCCYLIITLCPLYPSQALPDSWNHYQKFNDNFYFLSDQSFENVTCTVILPTFQDMINGVQEQFRFQSGSLEALKKIVDKHGGITLLPELACLDLPSHEKTKLKWFKDPKPVREVSLVTHRSFMKRKMTQVLYEEIIDSIPGNIRSKKNTEIIRWN